MVRLGELREPGAFINTVPHVGFSMGESSVAFQRARYEALTEHPLFDGLQFSTDREQIGEWAPLLIEGRSPGDALAASWSPLGTDVNFGEITRQLAASFASHGNASLDLSIEVDDLRRNPDGTWRVTYRRRDQDADDDAVARRRLHRRRGCVAAAPAEERHPGSRELCRLPGRRLVPATAGFSLVPASRLRLRQGGRGLAPDVPPASRNPLPAR